jgi:hypothetical protein
MTSKFWKLRACVVTAVCAVALAAPMTASAAADLHSRFDENGSRMAVKDTTYSTNVIVTNKGDVAATGAAVSVNVWGSANQFSPSWSPNPAFTPELGFVSGCASVAGSQCNLGTVAPGQSVVIPVTVTKLTHFGRISLSSYAWHDAGSNDQGYRTWQVQVTNGRKSLLRVSAEAAETAPARTDVVVSGEISNAGPDAIDAGRLLVNVTALDNTGDYFQPWNSSTKPEVGAIKSLTLSNGTTCAPYVDPVTSKAALNEYSCTVDGLAANARLTFQLVANWPTSKTDFSVEVDGQFISNNFLSEGSQAGFFKFMELAPEKTVDLQTTLASQALIGMDRIAPIKVTVKNTGNTRAQDVTLSGDARGGVGGMFDKASFPAACTGILKPIYASCSVGSIEPGASVTFVINVRAASKRGLFPVTIGASHDNDTFVYDTNPDNNSATVTFQVVKATVVPFLGVKETNPPRQNMTQLLRSGTKTTLVCPKSCKATVALEVKRAVAEKLGLVRKVRGHRRAKALPYIVIGKGVKSRTGSGKVVVIAKISRAYKAKLAKLKAPLTMSRVSTVVATDRSVRGASYTRTKGMVIRPAHRRRH